MKESESSNTKIDVVVLVSAMAEWKTVLAFHREPTVHSSPFGTYFSVNMAGRPGIMFYGGWGKVAAAASAQYVIDTYHPRLLINIGTCGGFEGKIKKGEIILVEETLIYDIYERMGNPLQAIHDYVTHIDLSYLCEPFPQKVRIGRMISADQDIDPGMVSRLKEEYEAVAADWESGAIAWTAQHNHTHLLILRGVSDLVNEHEGEIYSNNSFSQRAEEIMLPLLKSIPNWVRCSFWGNIQ